MAYIAPIHQPSSIRHALQIKLFEDEDECLVIAKTNRLEIFSLADNQQLVLRHTEVLNGTIALIQRLRPRDSPTELLFVGTVRSQYFTLTWDAAARELRTAQFFENAAERYMRDSQSQDRALVDPTGRFLVMHLWEGILSMLRLLPRKSKTHELEWTDSVRLSELFVKASTFLHSDTGHPKIALLYQSVADVPESKLATYRLTSDDRDSQASRFDPNKDREIALDIPDPGASLLIPVRRIEDGKRHNFRNVDDRAFLGGLVVVGETRLTYVDDITHAKVEAPLKEASIFVAWAELDERHYFLADDYGRMYLLTIHTDGTVVQGMEMALIGKTSRASCLIYMQDSNMLFVGSHNGDSQLWRISLTGADPSQYMQLVQVLRNIAPILDFTIMDMGNRESDSQLGSAYSSGQARIVTGSGVHKDGSLRSVRSGVGLEDIGILADLQDVRGLFSLKSHGAAKTDTLLVSFLTETRVFRFDASGEAEELEAFEGLSFDNQTLLATDLPGNKRLQVTTVAAALIDTDTNMVITLWKPPSEGITAASTNSKWLLLSVDGKSLVSLDIARDLAVAATKDFGTTDQVACVHASPHLLEAGVVGFFTSGNISIVDLATLNPLKGESLRRSDDNSSIPRDIALIQTLPPSIGGPTLFVSMEDGNVVTFNVAPDLSLSGRKSVILGTQQARFHLLPRADGQLTNIFATTENPSLIYGSEGRIVYSAVTAEDAAYVCDFDSDAFPEAVVVATDSAIKIARIDTERQTHVRPLEMGENVRRIAYSAKEQVFGLGCIKREIVQGEEVITNSFKLVDEVIFDKVGEPLMFEQSPSTELVECVIRASLPDSYGNPAERFLVGTSFLGEENGPSRADGAGGRLMVLGVDSDRNPYVLASHKFKGSCRCLAVLGQDIIVVALTKSVVLGRFVEESSTSGIFTRLASYRPSTYPVDLSVEGNIIAIGDLMKSVSLVEYFPATNEKPAMLMEVARHYQSAWATAVSHIEDQSWLEADAQGNLMVLRRNPDGPTLEDQRKMEITSEMNLGEMVNCVRKVAVETSPNAMIIPKAFIGTVEGAIYLFGTVASHAQDLLLRFQAKMADAVPVVGGLGFNRYRAFQNAERTAEGPFRFLDGELLERFLDMDEDAQKAICQGLGPSVEDMRNYIEELKRMH
ncbi:mono-functional DNA-alkylating methyl methanesulfonate N-term-domain-containing protein [Coniella lustricola]|uniref:DNA damage-binding protein 1 n=1 Tax=Coniella lustricola TaxID=2025994 RepID=A0A2T3AJB8_9PEZI|nr:mono-functional DNA-alkylating methyl methanesulfonate N-term-domain-containing protein [Coniella lustricola]